jgi:hypothetical protein
VVLRSVVVVVVSVLQPMFATLVMLVSTLGEQLLTTG